MPFKDVLVHVDNAKPCAARIEVAVQLAQAHQAHLVGLHIRGLPRVPSYVQAQYGPEVVEIQNKYLLESSAQARELFEKHVAGTGIGYEWRSVEGDLLDTVSLHARYADIAVVGQTDPEGEELNAGVPLADHLVVEAGRPVLVVPFAGRFPAVGSKVMVGWNASREATRAVNDALPILRMAKQVNVWAVNPTGGQYGHGEVPGADICLHLARHGVNAVCEYIKATDIDVGNQLLSRAADDGVDMLVMGAYGRSRLRELVLGGATRHILRHMTVPVLMSH